MDFEIRIRKEASLEIEKSLEYYLQISPHTAFSFDEDLDDCFSIFKKKSIF